MIEFIFMPGHYKITLCQIWLGGKSEKYTFDQFMKGSHSHYMVFENCHIISDIVSLQNVYTVFEISSYNLIDIVTWQNVEILSNHRSINNIYSCFGCFSYFASFKNLDLITVFASTQSNIELAIMLYKCGMIFFILSFFVGYILSFGLVRLWTVRLLVQVFTLAQSMWQSQMS